ncbi:MAG: hypothetical protein AB1483_09285 [Candidatus Zixiibacteriota bacterium]
MEISQEFMIDMALNIGGYLLAGAVSVLIYSLFAGRKKSAPVAEPVQTAEVTPPADEVISTPTEKRRVEFIRLAHENATAADIETRAVRAEQPHGGDRRDRAEIIRIARSMLKAGATSERIKRVLPISEAELSLLSMSGR